MYIYIAGYARSGTTLTSAILSSMLDAVDLGETNNLWRALLLDGDCGCGRPLKQCPVWMGRLHDLGAKLSLEALGGVGGLHVLSMNATAFRRMASPASMRARSSYAEVVEALARIAISDSQAKAIVDESKTPGMLPVLARMRMASRVFHLVRDPVAVAASESRGYAGEPGMYAYVPSERSRLRSHLGWHVNNRGVQLIAERLSVPYQRMSWESVTRQPRESFVRICEWIGLPYSTVRWMDERVYDLPPAHNPAGNPNRMRVGPVTVKHQDVGRASGLEAVSRVAAGSLRRESHD